jgi:hypothetical protein
MIRTVFTEGVLFLSPFAAYAIFLWATRSGVINLNSWKPRVLAGLSIVALLAVIAGLVAVAQFSGARPGSSYIPAHIENGRVVPGTTK